MRDLNGRIIVGKIVYVTSYRVFGINDIIMKTPSHPTRSSVFKLIIPEKSEVVLLCSLFNAKNIQKTKLKNHLIRYKLLTNEKKGVSTLLVNYHYQTNTTIN